MDPTYLLVDPLHEYAVQFAATIAARYGYRPLCLATHDGAARALRRHPALREFETLRVAPGDLEATGRRLRRERKVLAVIPFAESVLDPSVALLRGLDSTWNDAGVLALLRDKFALKRRLRSVHPALRIGFSRLLPAGSAKTLLRDAGLPERFVLKPNQGFGNRSVGFFTATTHRSALEEYVDAAGPHDLVLEEYLPGPEYFINGQVDHHGVCTCVAAFTYERVWANGSQVDWLTWKVPHASREFGILERFAQAVVAALCLRRSPFHLEAKVVDGSAHLVEMGARLAGMGNALICNGLHGGKLDVFALAADHYLHDGPREPARLDWSAYDAEALVYVHGVSLESGLVYALEGVERVERHPLFAGWVQKPALGQRLAPTTDIFSSPWCFILRAPASGRAALQSAAEELRGELRINASPAPVRKAAVAILDILRRGGRRVERLLPAG